MTDRSIEKEIEANNQRKQAQDDDGSVVDTVEEAIEPITDAIRRSDDDTTAEDVARRRAQNDAEQRGEG